jgi:hypothetical protein
MEAIQGRVIIVAVVALRFTRRRLGAGELRMRWPGAADGFELSSRVVGSQVPGPRVRVAPATVLRLRTGWHLRSVRHLHA